MRVCILSPEERGRFLHYDLPPVCDQHRHCSIKQALKKMADGLFEPVSPDTPYIWQPPQHYLTVKKSGKIGVVQRVRCAQPRNIQKPVFGEDNSNAPGSHVKQRGLSIEDIRKREPEFRNQQMLEHGTAVRSMNDTRKRRK